LNPAGKSFREQAGTSSYVRSVILLGPSLLGGFARKAPHARKVLDLHVK